LKSLDKITSGSDGKVNSLCEVWGCNKEKNQKHFLKKVWFEIILRWIDQKREKKKTRDF